MFLWRRNEHRVTEDNKNPDIAEKEELTMEKVMEMRNTKQRWLDANRAAERGAARDLAGHSTAGRILSGAPKAAASSKAEDSKPK